MESLDYRFLLSGVSLLQAVNFESREVVIQELPAVQVGSDLADLDGDGLLDLVVVTGAERGDDLYEVSTFKGTTLGFAFQQGGTLPLTTDRLILEIAIARLNSDNIPDVVIRTERALQFFYGGNGGVFVGGPAVDTPYPLERFELVDLSGNGMDDVILASYAFTGNEAVVSVNINDGVGGLSTTWEGCFPVELSPMAAISGGDYDNDGDSDVFVAVGGGRLHDVDYVILSNNGRGSFLELPVEPEAGVFTRPTAAVLRDMNADGDLDVLVAAKNGKDEGAFRIAFGDGHGGFGGWSEFRTHGPVIEVATGDLNGDTLPDIAFTYGVPLFSVENQAPGVGVIFTNLESGNLESKDLGFDRHGEIDTAGKYSSLSIQDVNQDGLNDVRWIEEKLTFDGMTRQVALSAREYHQTERYVVQDFGHSSTDEVHIGTFFDLDGDGHTDYVGVTRENEELGTTDRYVTLRFGLDGGRGFTEAREVSVNAAAHSLGFGDVNADGTTDIQVIPLGSSVVSTILLGTDRTVIDVVDSQAPSISVHAFEEGAVVSDVVRRNFHTVVKGTTVPRSFRDESLWLVRTNHTAITGDFNDDGVGGDVLLSHLNGVALLVNANLESVRLSDGDLDSSGKVDFQDFLILASNSGRSDNVTVSDGDLDEDGLISFSDVLVLAANFGEESRAGTAA